MLIYITLHFIALHYAALHNITSLRHGGHRARQREVHTVHHLVGLVVKASASRAEDPEVDSRFRVESYQ